MNIQDASDCQKAEPLKTFKTFFIRQANNHDLAEITRIWIEGSKILGKKLKANRDYAGFFQDKIESQNECFKIWVAEGFDSSILGWQALLPMRNNPVIFSKVAESSTYICPQNKFKGIGKHLLEYALKYAETTEIEYIQAFVNVNNKAILSITDSQGWQRIGKLPASLKSENP